MNDDVVDHADQITTAWLTAAAMFLAMFGRWAAAIRDLRSLDLLSIPGG